MATMGIRWFTASAAALAIFAAVAASGQTISIEGGGKAGQARTVQSGGKEAGCLSWRFIRTSAQDRKYPDRVRLVFFFVNNCPYTVFFTLATQKGVTNSADYNDSRVLAPGQMYGDELSRKTSFQYSRAKEKYLNFWVFQSNAELTAKAGNQPDLKLCNPKNAKVAKLVRQHSACPPYFSVD